MVKRRTSSSVWGQKIIILETIATKPKGLRRPDILKMIPSMGLTNAELTNRLQSLKDDELIFNRGQTWFLAHKGEVWMKRIRGGQ